MVLPPALPEDALTAPVVGLLAKCGVRGAAVEAASAEGDEWRYAIQAGGRSFEIGFSRELGGWARETTPGQTKHLTSNDHPPINSTAAALAVMVSRVGRALRDPTFPPRDPPVI